MSGRSSNALFAGRSRRRPVPSSKWRKGKKRLRVAMPDLVAFEKAIEEYGDEILKKAKKMMKFSKRRFIRNAQKMAPTKTGALKKSIKTGTIFVDIENLTYRSIPIWYAVYVEFVPPRIPFMWPAYMKEREYVKRTQKRNLKKITRDVARKVARAGVPKESAA